MSLPISSELETTLGKFSIRDILSINDVDYETIHKERLSKEIGIEPINLRSWGSYIQVGSLTYWGERKLIRIDCTDLWLFVGEDQDIHFYNGSIWNTKKASSLTENDVLCTCKWNKNSCGGNYQEILKIQPVSGKEHCWGVSDKIYIVDSVMMKG